MARGRHDPRLLEDRVRFETLLSDLFAGLIHVGASGLDAALENGLHQMVAFLGMDRGNLDEYIDGRPRVRVSWAEPGIAMLPSILAAEQFPWTADTLRRGSVVRLPRTEALPEEAAADRASYERVGTRSHLSIPLQAGGPMLGVLSFDSVRAERDWPDELVERLRLLSEAFASALQRKRMESVLGERLHFQRLLSDLSARLANVSALDFEMTVYGALGAIRDFLGVERAELVEFSVHGGPESSWTTQAMQAMDQAFADAAALGVTVYCAAGDSGSGDGEQDGKAVPEETVKGARLVIKGDRHTVRVGGETMVGTHRLDPSKEPKAIDATDTEGPYKGKTIHGIYELTDDTYKVCFAAPGKDRPTEFASKPGSGHRLIVMRRQKP